MDCWGGSGGNTFPPTPLQAADPPEVLLSKPRLRLERSRTEPPAAFSLSLKTFPAQGQAQPNACPSQASPPAAQQEVLGLNAQVSQGACTSSPRRSSQEAAPCPRRCRMCGSRAAPSLPKHSWDKHPKWKSVQHFSDLVCLITFWGTGGQLCGVVSLLKPGVRYI